MDSDRMFSPYCVAELHNWGLRDINERINHWLWRQSICPLLGNMEGAYLLGTLRERWDFVFIRECLKNGSGNRHLSLYRGPAGEPGMGLNGGGLWKQCLWALWGEPGGRAPLLRILKGMLSKALETGVFSIGFPLWGTWHGCTFTRDSREGWDFSIRRTFTGESEIQ